MKGKIKSIFVHIINGILILGLGFYAYGEFDMEDIAELNRHGITSIACFIGMVAILAAEIVLIIFQARRKYSKAVFITGLIANSLLVLSAIAVVVANNTKKIRDLPLMIGIIVAVVGILGIVLYILINKDNKGVVAAPAKAVEAKKEEVTEEKPEVVEKEPVVAEKKPAAVKKAPVKKVAPKKPAAKKPAAKKPTTKKPAAKKKK